LTRSLQLHRPISEVLTDIQIKFPSFKTKLAATVVDSVSPTTAGNPESFPEMETELIRILGLDIAGDFRPVRVPRWDGDYDLRVGYKLTASTAATNKSNVMELLVKNIRPVLIALRNRIDDTIDRIPAKYDTTN
jgi:hypothetical protein